jgi:Fe-Mn family superoxide dismutase
MPVKLPDLPYAYDALEPHLDAKTLEIHHDKHHKAYVTGFNETEAAIKEARDKGDKRPIPALEAKLAFHGGGHVNHTLFWANMAPAGKGGGGIAAGPLADAINRDFGAFDKFKMLLSATALGVEGNGWAWLVYQPILARLEIAGVMNHESQIVLGSIPILGIDVWEHAYYLKFQNRRADFIEAWWNVVNWSEAQRRFDLAMGMRRAASGVAAGPPSARTDTTDSWAK